MISGKGVSVCLDHPECHNHEVEGALRAGQVSMTWCPLMEIHVAAAIQRCSHCLFDEVVLMWPSVLSCCITVAVV